MKYLKKFNEELRPQTYLSAAKKREAEAVLKDELHGEGAGRDERESAKKLRSWAREMEKKEISGSMGIDPMVFLDRENLMKWSVERNAKWSLGDTETVMYLKEKETT
jgi:hypothetical protein